MKDCLLLLPRFILTLILGIFVILCVMLVAASLDYSYVKLDAALVLGRVVVNLPAVLLSGIFFALFSGLFRIIRKPGIKLLSFALLAVFLAASLFFGLFGLGRLIKGVEAPPEPSAFPLKPGILYEAGDAYLRLGNKDGVVLREVLTYGVGRAEFRLHPEAVYKPEKDTLRLLDTGEEIRVGESASVKPPAFLSSLFRDLVYLSGKLTPSSMLDWRTAVNVVIVTFFGLSLWTLVRLTRWPLFNLIVALGAFRFALFLIRFLGKEFLPEAAKIVKSDWLLHQIPFITLGTAAVILFFFCILMKPLAEWKRDLEYD